MELSSDLNRAQAQILYEDLTDNQYLAFSEIPMLDKELKTPDKRIIPTLNNMHEKMNTMEDTIKDFSKELSTTVADLEVMLKKYIDKGIEDTVILNTEKILELQKTLEKYVKDEIKNESNTGTSGAAGTGGEDMKAVFIEKKLLLKGETIETPFKLTEIQDLKRQIIVVTATYPYPRREYFINETPCIIEDLKNREIHTEPVSFMVDPETDKISISDTGENNDHMIYFYNLV